MNNMHFNSQSTQGQCLTIIKEFLPFFLLFLCVSHCNYRLEYAYFLRWEIIWKIVICGLSDVDM